MKKYGLSGGWDAWKIYWSIVVIVVSGKGLGIL